MGDPHGPHGGHDDHVEKEDQEASKDDEKEKEPVAEPEPNNEMDEEKVEGDKEKVEAFSVSVALSLDVEYSDDLADTNSDAFKALAKRVENDLNTEEIKNLGLMATVSEFRNAAERKRRSRRSNGVEAVVEYSGTTMGMDANDISNNVVKFAKKAAASSTFINEEVKVVKEISVSTVDKSENESDKTENNEGEGDKAEAEGEKSEDEKTEGEGDKGEAEGEKAEGEKTEDEGDKTEGGEDGEGGDKDGDKDDATRPVNPQRPVKPN